MGESAARAPLSITRCGVIAREILADDGETEVIALFERSFYLACPRGIVCIGNSSIGAGPINVEVDVDDASDWRQLGAGLDDKGITRAGLAVVGDGLSLDLASGSTWTPPVTPAFDADSARRGVETVRTHSAGRTMADGLAGLIIGGRQGGAPRSLIERAAEAPVRCLAASLPSALGRGTWTAEALRAALLLVGLGPGFTPSGDDLLGGLMLALTAARQETLRDSLWEAIEPELGELTTPASAMHLSAAADGMAAETVHLLLREVMAGHAAIGTRLAAVASLGHSSGWDIAAGLVIGLDAAAAGARTG
jgi:hypothetical protein